MTDTADLDYVHIVHRLGATVGDTPDDLDSNPDFVPVTEGTITIVPTSPESKILVNGMSVSACDAPIICTVDSQGYLSYNGTRGVWIVDLGSAKVIPPVPRDKAAYTITYSGLKFGTQTFKKVPVSINPDSVALAGADFNLTDATSLPLPAGVTLAYVQSIADEAIAARDALLAQKGEPGGIAALDADGNVLDGSGNPVTGGGGGTALTSYATQVESLNDYPAAFPPDLTGVTPGDIGAQPAGSYQAAGDYATNTALTSGLAGKVPTSRTVAGKPLSANVTLASGDIGDFTTAVDSRVQNVVGAAPAALDTLAELATALGDDANFAGTVTTALATKYVKPGTGIPSTDMTTAVQTSLGKADAALSTSGTAAAATKLATARQINGHAFDGTADIAIGAGDITSGLFPMAQATPGARFTVLSTTVWPARPSSRTDIYFDWIDAGGLGTDPPGWLDGDSVLKAA